MEFFEFFGAAEFCFEFMQGGITLGQVYLCFAIAGGFYLLCLLFGGIGLAAMAKREGRKQRALGFLPFANTFYAGKIAGEATFFGQKIKRAGLYAMLAEIGCFVMKLLYVLAVILLQPYYEEIIVDNVVTSELNYSIIPVRLLWLADGMFWFSLVEYLLYFVQLIFLCVLFTALYRKYYARSPIMMTFLSALLPFRGFTLFAVRNNTPVDYNAYLRRKTEEYVRRNYPGGFPGGSGDFGPRQNGGNTDEGPFSDFGGGQESPKEGTGDDPFEEFGSGGSGNSAK